MYTDAKMEAKMPIGIHEPVSLQVPLIERAAVVNDRLEKNFQLAEKIYGEMFGNVPTNESNGGDIRPRFSLEEYITQSEYTVSRLEDCLYEILNRLRG